MPSDRCLHYKVKPSIFTDTTMQVLDEVDLCCRILATRHDLSFTTLRVHGMCFRVRSGMFASFGCLRTYRDSKIYTGMNRNWSRVCPHFEPSHDYSSGAAHASCGSSNNSWVVSARQSAAETNKKRPCAMSNLDYPPSSTDPRSTHLESDGNCRPLS